MNKRELGDEIIRLRRERDAFRAWVKSHPQPHPEECMAWGWAQPLSTSTLEKCTCGLEMVWKND